MMSIRTFVILLSATIVLACNKYDDSQLWSKLEEHESRITKLEKLCRELNNNISALQTLVVALQNNDYVTSVIPIIEYGQEVGYSIRFSNGDIAKIYHGKDGKDGSNGENGADGKDGKDGENGRDGKDGLNGSTPVIGVAQDSDGVYYWTIDGQWLLDNEGNKLRVTGENGRDGTDGKDGVDGKDGKDGTDGIDGKDGKDCIMPKMFLTFRNGYWYVAYDGDWKNAIQLGKCVGEDGKDGVDGIDGKDGKDGSNGKDAVGFFRSVSVADNYAVFSLINGDSFSIPIYDNVPLIKFKETNKPKTVMVDIIADIDSIESLTATTEYMDFIYTKAITSWETKVKIIKEDKTAIITYIPNILSERVLMVVNITMKDGSSYSISKIVWDCVDLSLEETANCYIISEPGAYRFLPTEGNSTNLVDISSLKPYQFTSGEGSSAYYNQNGIFDIGVYDGYIVFKSTNKKGIYRITVSNERGHIIWAWLIWVTERPNDQEYNGGAVMMDRNLGANSPTDLGIEEADIMKDWIYSSQREYRSSFKTKYDPCPIGYRIPSIDVYKMAFPAHLASGDYLMENAEQYLFKETDIQGFTHYAYNIGEIVLKEPGDCWYPLTRYNSGKQEYVTRNVYLHFIYQELNNREYAIKAISTGWQYNLVRCEKNIER